MNNPVIHDIVMGMEAFGSRYFNYEEENCTYLRPSVEQARRVYEEMKSKGLSFDQCSRIARSALVNMILDSYGIDVS